MKTTVKAVGLFLLITAAVTSGVLISNHFIEMNRSIRKSRESMRQTCAEVAAETSSNWDELKAKCKAEGF